MPVPFRTILSPIDFDHNSLAALELAGQLAKLTKAKILLLHVVPAMSSREKAPGYVDMCLAEERAARKEMEEIAGTRLIGIPSEIITRTGDPAVAIIHAEEELQPDLVVVATHACKRTPHRFAGSVAERIVRESICPVLTMRACVVGDLDLVGAHMTTVPVAITRDRSAGEVWKKMIEQRLRCVPVVENGRLAGIVTDRDLRGEGRVSDDTPIASLMTKEVVTVGPTTSMQEAARLFLECEVGALPVVEGEVLVGMITTTDILQAFLEGPSGGSREPRLMKVTGKAKQVV